MTLCRLTHVTVCVTTETRPLDRLGQLGEFEQDSNTDSEHCDNVLSAASACGASKQPTPSGTKKIEQIKKSKSARA